MMIDPYRFGNPTLNIDDIAMVGRYEAWKETPVTDGTAVGSITDWSGNSNTLTAAGSARPTYKTNIINTTLPVWRFDGSANIITKSGISAMSNTKLRWYFMVYATRSTATPKFMYNGYNTDSANSGDLSYTQASGGATSHRFTGTGANYVDTGPENAGHTINAFYFASVIGDASNVVCHGIDNVGAFVSSSIATPTGPPTGTFTLNLGALQGPSGFWTGDIAAFFMGNGTISGGDEVRIRNYCNAIFGVQVS